MEITSVKLQQSGYLVNGTMHVPNAEGNIDYQAVQAWIAEGNTPEPEFTAEEIAAAAQAATNAESLAYLNSTDWYVIRSQETGVAVPAEITTARAAARAAVV